jgi:hypothetical protein
VHESADAIVQGRPPAVNVRAAVQHIGPGVTACKSAFRDAELLDVPD